MTIESQDDTNPKYCTDRTNQTLYLVDKIEELSMPRCDIVRLQKQIEQLKEENNKLKQAIDVLGGMKCSKCGEYHHKHYVCWHCGYDYTAPKELDK